MGRSTAKLPPSWIAETTLSGSRGTRDDDDEDGRGDEVGVLVGLAEQPDVGRRTVVELDLAHRCEPKPGGPL